MVEIWGVSLGGNGSYNWNLQTRWCVLWCLWCPYLSWWRSVKASLAWHTVCVETSFQYVTYILSGDLENKCQNRCIHSTMGLILFFVDGGAGFELRFYHHHHRWTWWTGPREEGREKNDENPSFFLIARFHHRKICRGFHNIFYHLVKDDRRTQKQ